MRHSVKLKYLLSYFTLMLFSIIVFGSFIYTYSYQNNRNYISTFKYAAFENAVSQIDSLFANMSMISAHISNLEGREDLAEDSIVTLLTYYENLAVSPMNIYLYQQGSTDIYTSNGKIPYAAMEQSYKDNADLTMSLLFVRLNTLSVPMLYKLENGSGSPGMIAYIYPLRLYSRSPSYTLIFILSDDVIRGTLEDSMGGHRGMIHIYNQALQTFYTDFDPVEDSDTFSELFRLKGTGVLENTSYSRQEVVMRNVSSASNLIYLAVERSNSFFFDMSGRQIPVVTAIIVIAFSCAALAVLLTRSSYKPIRELVFDIVGDTDLDSLNEFDAIKLAYKDSALQNEQLTRRINMQYEIISSNFALRLIRGKWKNDDEMAYYRDCSEFIMDMTYNAAIVIKTPDIPANVGIDLLLRESGYIVIDGVSFIYSELPHEAGICYIVNFDADDPAKKLEGIAEELCRHLTDKTGITLRVGVGEAVSDPYMVNNSFYQAIAAMRSGAAAYIGASDMNKQISIYGKYDGNEVDSYVQRRFEQSLLIEGITYGDEAIALSSLDEFFRSLERTCSYLEERMLCFELVNAVIKTASSLNLRLNLNQFDGLVVYDTFEQFEIEFRQLISYICQLSYENRLSHETEERSGLIKYINQNYCNIDICLSLVSEKLNISKAKINSILKEDFGYSFAQYISLLRLNEIRRMLVSTDMSINDIVTSVGYIDVPNFTRKFKSVEGVTMGQYRALYKK